jgi:FG-GAP repeat
MRTVLLLTLLCILVSSGVTQSFASTSSPNVKHRTLTSPVAQEGGAFGSSTATDGKVTVVGAPDETADGQPDAGNVYVFNASTGALIESFSSPNAQPFGDFGTSVSVSGQVVVVGAYGETADGDGAAGHAYTFNTMTGALISTLTSPNAQSDGYFGWSVAVSGKTVVVGAPFETAGGFDGAGNAYTFDAATGALVRSLSSPDSQSDGYFGYAVAASGKTLVVGAYGEAANGFNNAGHAYTFDAKTGAMISTLSSPNRQTDGDFGVSVAASGSVVAVGARGESADGFACAGHAYMFSVSGVLTNTLTSPNAQGCEDFGKGDFGWSVAASKEFVVVGAPDETADGFEAAGHAYTFSAATGGLVSTLTSPNAQEDGSFGGSAAASGKTVAVGAPSEAAGGDSGAGHDYIF